MRLSLALVLALAGVAPAAAQSVVPQTVPQSVPQSHIDSVNAQLRREPKQKASTASPQATSQLKTGPVPIRAVKRPAAAKVTARDTTVRIPLIQPIARPKKR